MFSSLFWAIFRPYYLEVLKTYSSFYRHHLCTEENHCADKTEKEDKEATTGPSGLKEAARKYYCQRSTGSSFWHRLYYLLLLGYAGRTLLLGWSLMSSSL